MVFAASLRSLLTSSHDVLLGGLPVSSHDSLLGGLLVSSHGVLFIRTQDGVSS